MRLTAIAALVLGLASVVVLALDGGAMPYARPLFGSAALFALVVAALGMGRRFRIPQVSWLALVFAPAVLVMALQLLPLGWHHPWTGPDLQLLHQQTGSWSLDAASTYGALVWTLSLAAAGLVWHCAMRSERARILAYVVLGIAMVHAVAGLVLALAAVDWPIAASGFVVRGCFIYQNQAAAFSACVLPLAILLARDLGRPWLWFGVGALALAVILSTSRGGTMVCAAVCLPVVWYSLPRRRRGWYFSLVVGAVSIYLALIGLHDISLRFGRLIGPEGLTLDGRLIIWHDTLPLVAQAGPLGCGVDTTQDVWWRTANTSFPGLTINHVHSDPLEWVLEFGWGGALAVAAGLMLLAWRIMRTQSTARADPALFRGGALGLLILLVHSCADFIWNREAIALMAVALLILTIEARDDYHLRPARSSLRLRLGALALAAVLAALLPLAWILDDEAATIGTVQRLVGGRRDNGLSIDSTYVREVMDRPARSAHLAVVQARLALDLTRPGAAATALSEQDRQALYQQADRHLRQAAALAPSDPGAWVERARLASARMTASDPDLSQVLERILALSPTWSYAEAVILDCMRRGATRSVPPATRLRLIDGMLALDQAQPSWFFSLADAQLPPGALSRRLGAPDCPRQLAASAQWWLATYGAVPDYLAVWRRLAPPEVVLPPSLWLAAPLVDPALSHVEARVALQVEQRRADADALAGAGLPIPEALSQAVLHDGMPWQLWATPLTLTDPLADAHLAKALSTELYRPWAAGWFDAASSALQAFSGSTLRITTDTDPRLISRLLLGHALSPGERSRLTELVHAHRVPHWASLEGVHWSWLWCDQEVRPLIRTAQWQGWVVDGAWQGWRRGLITSATLEPGLHRVALLALPLW